MSAINVSLRAEIQRGIESGPATPLDMASIKTRAREQFDQQRRRSRDLGADAFDE